jgi:hypothetical protein
LPEKADVMNSNETIESLGRIIKEETLQHVDFNIIQNTLVLENLEPFPGYHGENMPFESMPESIFLITAKLFPSETIFRISQRLCQYHHLNFNACPAEINILNNQYYAIRIKGLTAYSSIADIQGCYIDQGITFLKHKKIKGSGIIKVEKIFRLENLDEFIYKDRDDELTYYLNIPYSFNWNLFKKVTYSIKNNIENRNFDAAMGFIYRATLLDFIRIYAKSDIARLRIIREKYLEEINRIRQQ